MKPPFDHSVADDVAACSAAVVFNVLPSILRLAPPDAFDRLRQDFLTAISTYTEAVDGFGLPPEPSHN